MASDRKAFARMRRKLYSCMATMKETSASKADDNVPASMKSVKQYVVTQRNIASFNVVDFDELQRKWYPCEKGVNHPCSVDAVHLGVNGDIYAIEFKIGGVDTSNLVRKIHETIMGFKENLGAISNDFSGYDYYRNNLTYIVVASDLELATPGEQTLYRALRTFSKPWECPQYPHRWKLKPLEGVLISKVYELSPTMFARFVKEEKWIEKTHVKPNNLKSQIKQ